MRNQVKGKTSRRHGERLFGPGGPQGRTLLATHNGLSLGEKQALTGWEDEGWRVDEHWGSIAAYLAQMHFPNEG